MAKCRNCGRKGIFLALNIDGFCQQCEVLFNMDIDGKIRIIEDSQRIINKTNSFFTKMNRMEAIIYRLEELKELENNGISNIPIDVKDSLDAANSAKLELIKEELESTINNAKMESELGSTKAGKLSPLKKAYKKISDTCSQYAIKNCEAYKIRIKDLLHETELNTYIEEAKKAEFKGNKKKAIDKYQEALFFLKNDDISDGLQKDMIDKISVELNKLESK